MNLVTGGTGFLGAYLIRHLLEKGEQVRATKRSTSKMDLVKTFADQVEWVDADILDIFSMEEALVGINKVYHVAALVSFDPKDKESLLTVNVKGTANVVNACLAANIQKLVHVSSNAALGREVGKQHVNEDAQWNSSKMNSDYAISKYESELEVWRGVAEGLNAVIVNPSLIIGSGFWNEGTASFFNRIDSGLKFFPVGTTGFVDVRDVVQIMHQLMESEITGKRFITSAEDLSFETFFTYVAHAINKKPPHIKAKPWMTALAWRLEKIKCALSGQRPLVTQASVRNSMNVYYYENKKVKEALNYSFHSIEKTVKETAIQFLHNKNSKSKSDMLPSLSNQ